MPGGLGLSADTEARQPPRRRCGGEHGGGGGGRETRGHCWPHPALLLGSGLAPGSPSLVCRYAPPQVGVTSWGFGCAEGTPGVYSDVAAGLGWIRGAMAHLLREEAAGRIPRLPVSHPA